MKKKNKIMGIMGHLIDLNKIGNPHLLEVINQRISYGDFKFWYRDHKQYKESFRPQKKKYDEYIKYTEKWDKYSDKKHDDYEAHYGG